MIKACLLLAWTLVGASPPQSSAQSPAKLRGPGDPLESLTREVEAMRVGSVAWRGIAWKSCLLDGLREARASKKPALLWVFIDRPVDDARC